MEQGVAGSNPARFNFLINFFFVSNLKGGGHLIKSYKQLLFPFHRIASYCFFMFINNCVEQMAKLKKWCGHVEVGPGSNLG